MIAEIGFLLACYVLWRLTPDWKVARPMMAVLTALVALVVLFDLASRTFSDTTLAGRFSSAEKDAKVESEPRSVDEMEEEITYSTTTADGGSVTLHLGYGIAVAKGSSLHREWIAVHDKAFPADVVGTPGVRPLYKKGGRYSSGEYRYQADFKIEVREDLRAVEVRFITFNVWGEHVNSLNYSEVIDLEAPKEAAFTGEWRLHSENEVENHYASIAFVARVRTADGQVLTADLEPILAEAQKFSRKFTVQDIGIEPDPSPEDGQDDADQASPPSDT